MADELKYKSSGDIGVNVIDVPGWLGGAGYQPGPHRLQFLGFSHGESSKGNKMMYYVFKIVDGPGTDAGRVYQYQMAYKTTGGLGLMRGIAEGFNPSCIKKGDKDGKAYEVISMDRLMGYEGTVDFIEEEYTDAKTQQVKTSCKADWTSLRDVSGPGSNSGEEVSPSSATDLDEL